jgi:hypothetical protein
MAVIEYEMPTSWDSKGMDWDDPDPRRADYAMAIRQALMERAAVLHTSLSRDVTAISPWKAVSLKSMGAVVKAIEYMASSFVNAEWDGYKEDFSDFPKMWTYRELVMERGCGMYAFASSGDLLVNGGEWLKTMKNALDRLHVIQCGEITGTAASASGSRHDPPFGESIGDAMSQAMRERTESRTHSVPSSFHAWSGNTHWCCPRKDDPESKNGYCGYAQLSGCRIEKVRSWLAGRSCDFLGYALVERPKNPVPYSVELATSVFDSGETGFDEGMNEFRIHMDDPRDVRIMVGSLNEIPRNSTVPTSDFDSDGNATHRRSAKIGYEGRFWALLDYACENGFMFKEV